MKEKDLSDAVDEAQYYYGIRLLVKNTSMPVSEITAVLGMEPDHFWNAGERTFTSTAMWSYTSWTEGKRPFFDEIHEALVWLGGEQEFIAQLRVSGGEFQVIAQLPGGINIGDVLKLETMALAVKLGVTIGVEVFPNLLKPAPGEQ